MQVCLDKLHDRVKDSDVLLNQVMGLQVNHGLALKTNDSPVNAPQAIPCIAPNEASNHDKGDTVA